MTFLYEVLIPQDASLVEAKRFYEAFFDTNAQYADENKTLIFDDGPINFRVAYSSKRKTPSRYKKGKTPRREFRVDDIEQWEQHAVSIGAKAVIRSNDGHDAPPGTPATYVWLKDPFGHIWTLRDEGDFQQKSTQPPQPRVVPERQKIEAKRAEKRQELEAKKE